jgi:hypothetical protein
MKNILLAFLLFASLVGYGQGNKLEGTIWATNPVWRKGEKDSVYYSLTFANKYAVLKIKHKKFARTELFDTLAYPFIYKSPLKMQRAESVAFMDEIIDDSFHFTHFSDNRVDSILKIEGVFYLKTENTLNGTVWINKDGYKLSFTPTIMNMYYRNNQDPMKFNYEMSGDKITLDISNKLKILPGRRTLEFEEPGNRKVIYTKVTQ